MFTYFVATFFFFAAACTFHANGNHMSNASKEAAEPIELQIKFLNNIVFQYFNAT
jgi:hypothetical protein